LDKLQDFKPTTKMDASKLYRFSCDCYSPEDALDISVDDIEGEKYITITTGFFHHNLWFRVKAAFKMLKGEWMWDSFCVRKEDTKVLSDIFNPDVKYKELP
jgi:hypothetical protein